MRIRLKTIIVIGARKHLLLFYTAKRRMLNMSEDNRPYHVIVVGDGKWLLRNNYIQITNIIEIVERCFELLKNYWLMFKEDDSILIQDVVEEMQEIVMDLCPQYPFRNLAFKGTDVEETIHPLTQLINTVNKIVESLQDIVLFKFRNNEELNNVDIEVLDRNIPIFKITPYFTPTKFHN